MITSDSWSAYAAAVLYVATPWGTVRVRPAALAQNRGEYPWPRDAVVHVVTACNPGGVISGLSDNLAAQARLEADLVRTGLQRWPAAGGDRGWKHVEPSVAISGLDRASAVALGVRYGQDAVFELNANYRVVVSCQSMGTYSTGWVIDLLSQEDAEAGRALDGPAPIRVISVAIPDAPKAGAASTNTAAKTSTSAAAKTISQPYPSDWLAPGGYLTTLGQRQGELMTLSVGGRRVVVRGDGSGRVSLEEIGNEILGPYPVVEALTRLAEHDAFNADEDPDRSYASGAWDAGDVASVVAPWYDLGDHGGVGFVVDEIEMCTDGGGRASPYFPSEAGVLTLDSNQWELEGGGGSPGNADSGNDYLLRIGPRYVMYQCAAGESIVDELDAATDEQAIERFRVLITAVDS